MNETKVYSLYEPVITFRRRQVARKVLNTPAEIAERFRELFAEMNPDPTKEAVVIITLSARNMEVGHRLLSLGTSNQALIGTPDTLRAALYLGGRAFAIAHNHPSGDPQPSTADVTVTRKIRAAAEVVDLHMHDHIILGEADVDPVGVGFYSFRQVGLI